MGGRCRHVGQVECQRESVFWVGQPVERQWPLHFKIGGRASANHAGETRRDGVRGHEATETGFAYAPVSQAHGHNHGVRGGGVAVSRAMVTLSSTVLLKRAMN